MNVIARLPDAPQPPAHMPHESVPGDSRQYVTFHVQEGTYAVPLAEVQEIIRMPDVVQVPLGPSSIAGLANLRGTVMAVSSLRRIFNYPDIAHDDATRVVVINQGIPVGLVVDRMAAVVTADPAQIETVRSIENTVDTDLLRGMIKSADGSGMIMILDSARLVANDFHTERARSRAGERGADAPAAGPQAGAVQAGQADELQLVSFEVAGQEYALAIENVQEIVQVAEPINRVPGTARHVLGVVTLRQRLLPLVSLREMFGLVSAPLNERNKIVVVPLPDGASVGIVMDMVKEVLRVSRSLLDPVPALMQANTRGEIQGICRLDGGRRLVLVLSADALFDNETVRCAAAAGGPEGESAMEEVMGSAGPAIDDEEQFVVFRLGQEDYGVPIALVQEILRVPEQLTRVPRAPAFIKGVVNLRGAVLPVIDQRARFELEEMEPNDRQRIMVFTIDGIRTGFIVDAVSEVMKIPRLAIGPTPAMSAEQARIVSRIANLEQQRRMILLIDPDQLLERHEVGAVVEAGSDAVPACPSC
nr:chemotaxis protein CheW [uncultured Lichenicoccus sp.]